MKRIESCFIKYRKCLPQRSSESNPAMTTSLQWTTKHIHYSLFVSMRKKKNDDDDDDDDDDDEEEEKEEEGITYCAKSARDRRCPYHGLSSSFLDQVSSFVGNRGRRQRQRQTETERERERERERVVKRHGSVLFMF